MQTLMLTVEYDGTRYAGWKAAPKKENLDTVSARIHTALARLLKEDIQLFCAAKTDPGVHARGQILSFQTTSSLLPSALKSSLNQVLPQDIAVLDARQVSERFHAELLPKHCIWELCIKTGPTPDVFRQKYTLFLPDLPDPLRMQEAFSFLKGRHDVRCFSPVKKKKAVMRELYSLRIEHSDDEMQLFLEGSDFLPFMPATLMQLCSISERAHWMPVVFLQSLQENILIPGMLLHMHCIFMILFIFQIERMIFNVDLL